MNDNRASSEQLLPTSATNNNLPEEDEPTAPLANMGVTLSTAKVIAPLSFAIDFACQVYGMTATPNMKTIHDQNPCAFSPQPFAIAGFFSPQQILQLVWMRELYRSPAQVENGTLRYVPWYAFGNICIALWMFLWNGNNLKGSNIPVIFNTLTQVYYLVALRNKYPSTYQSKLTNIINITFAGIGILDLFHNTAAGYYKGVAPSTLVQVATAIAAPVTAFISPLLFGSCIAYDLAGVAIGQHQLAQKAIGGLTNGGGGGEGWARMLGGLGLGVAGIVGLRAYNGAKWL